MVDTTTGPRSSRRSGAGPAAPREPRAAHRGGRRRASRRVSVVFIPRNHMFLEEKQTEARNIFKRGFIGRVVEYVGFVVCPLVSLSSAIVFSRWQFAVVFQWEAPEFLGGFPQLHVLSFLFLLVPGSFLLSAEAAWSCSSMLAPTCAPWLWRRRALPTWRPPGEPLGC